MRAGPAPWWPLVGGLASLAGALTWWAAPSPGGMRDGGVVVARVGEEASGESHRVGGIEAEGEAIRMDRQTYEPK